jgi:hypothetical protein
VIALILIYALMIVFDAFVLGGCVYLIVAHNWSAWWMLLAVLMAGGSNPKRLILAVNGLQEPK